MNTVNRPLVRTPGSYCDRFVTNDDFIEAMAHALALVVRRQGGRLWASRDGSVVELTNSDVRAAVDAQLLLVKPTRSGGAMMRVACSRRIAQIVIDGLAHDKRVEALPTEAEAIALHRERADSLRRVVTAPRGRKEPMIYQEQLDGTLAPVTRAVMRQQMASCRCSSCGAPAYRFEGTGPAMRGWCKPCIGKADDPFEQLRRAADQLQHTLCKGA